MILDIPHTAAAVAECTPDAVPGCPYSPLQGAAGDCSQMLQSHEHISRPQRAEVPRIASWDTLSVCPSGFTMPSAQHPDRTWILAQGVNQR